MSILIKAKKSLVFLKTAIVLLAILPTVGQAFTTSTNINNTVYFQSGTNRTFCSMTAFALGVRSPYTYNDGFARVWVNNTSYYAGGTQYDSGRPYSAPYNSPNPITEQSIADCLGIDVSNVTLISQNGADVAWTGTGTGFFADNYLGFRFSIDVASNHTVYQTYSGSGFNAGSPLPAGTYHIHVGNSPDLIAPTTSSVNVSSSGTTVTLGMDEALNSSTPAAAAFAVTIDGTSVTPTAVTISGTNVALTLATAIEAGSTVSVAYTKPSSGNVLEDAAGNNMASFDTAGSITTTNNSTVIPSNVYLQITPRFQISSYQGSATNRNTLVNSIPVGNNIQVSTTAYVTSGAWPTDVRIQFNSGNSAVFEAGLRGSNQYWECTNTEISSDLSGYKKWDIDCWIQNRSSSTIDNIYFKWNSWQSKPYIQNFTMSEGRASDTTAPTTSTATVSSAGTTVTLGMSETLGASTPVAAAFAVTIDGTSVTPTAVTISGTNVALTLATAIEAGSTVSVAYTKPSSGNVLEDAAGNDMASFDTAGSITTTNSSTIDTVAPVVTISGPTEVVVDDFTVTLTFSEVVTSFAAEDITVANGAKGTFTETTAGKVFTLIVTPELGTTVAISVAANETQDAAGNGNEASNVFEVLAGSPASEFDKELANIKQAIVTEVQNTLQNAISANVSMLADAKSRFIANNRDTPGRPVGFSGENNLPFDVDGVANGDVTRLSTSGTFFGQVGNDEGTKRRILFGDFSIVGEKGGSVTGSISGKVAWEQNLSDKTMYGYFIGAQVNQTDIKTTFIGKQQGYGVNIGSYVVNQVAENMYIDGFVSLGMGKSDLDMSNDVLSLAGTYETKSATIGGALTGVYDMESYELWPELAFTAGKTQIGNAKFTGRAYGLVDNNLSLDAGDVTVANLTLRPEVRIPLEAGNQSGATSQVTFAPRAICERITTDVTTENCGRGAELGFIRRSGDGLTQITGRLSRDYVGTSTRTGLELKLEHRF